MTKIDAQEVFTPEQVIVIADWTGYLNNTGIGILAYFGSMAFFLNDKSLVPHFTPMVIHILVATYFIVNLNSTYGKSQKDMGEITDNMKAKYLSFFARYLFVRCPLYVIGYTMMVYSIINNVPLGN